MKIFSFCHVIYIKRPLVFFAYSSSLYKISWLKLRTGIGYLLSGMGHQYVVRLSSDLSILISLQISQIAWAILVGLLSALGE
jgi:hypothetical protein